MKIGGANEEGDRNKSIDEKTTSLKKTGPRTRKELSSSAVEYTEQEKVLINLYCLI